MGLKSDRKEKEDFEQFSIFENIHTQVGVLGVAYVCDVWRI